MAFNLHPYQEEAIALIEQADRDTCLTLPTGTGKSVTALALIDRLVFRGARVLVAVPYTPLVAQFRDEILRFFPHLAPKLGIYAAEFGAASRGLNATAQVVIAMLQTIESRCIEAVEEGEDRQEISPTKAIPGGDFTHIILDEAHLSAFRLGYSVLRQMYPKARFVYLTATPYRDDGGRFPPRTQFIQTITVGEAIDKGYLADYEIYPLLPEGSQIDGESYSAEMSSAISAEMLLEHYRKNTSDSPKRSLFIFPDKSALNYYIEAFREEGLLPAVVVDSTKVKEREGIFNDFKSKPDSIIFSVNVLCAGCNLPQAEDLYLLRSPGLSLFTQISGRVLRRHGDKVARIFDYFNNCLRHPSPRALPAWEQTIKSNELGVECRECKRVNPCTSQFCLDCGARLKFPLEDGLEQLALAIQAGAGMLSESAIGSAHLQMRHFGVPLIDCDPAKSEPEKAFAYFKQRCFLRQENPRKVFVLMKQAGFNYKQTQHGARNSSGAIFAHATIGSLWVYTKYICLFNLSPKEQTEMLANEFPPGEVEAWKKLMIEFWKK